MLVNIDDVLKTILLFEATFTASAAIKDKPLQNEVKIVFEQWFAESRELKKLLLADILRDKEMTNNYEELAAAVYEFTSICLQTNDYNAMIAVIRNELERQNQTENTELNSII